MFVWVFFENLGKGLYTAAGYAGLIQYYIEHSHSPAVWKAVMGLAAEPRRDGGSDAGADRNLTRHTAASSVCSRGPRLLSRFLYLGSLWVSEFGTAWIWELLVPVLASLGLAIGSAGRTWGVDGWLARRWPNAPWWLV